MQWRMTSKPIILTKIENVKTAICITLLGSARLQDEAKLASNSEVLGHLGSNFGSQGVNFCSKLQCLDPTWLQVGGIEAISAQS